MRPSGLATDASGNLYYADTARNQVLESTAAGALVVVAGTGEQGFSGDGGPASAALLSAPQAVALAPDGTLYVADTGNNCIRTISPTGVITTSASGLHTPMAVALDSSGNLIIADTAAHKILRLTGSTLTTIAGTGTQGFAGDGAAATAALLDTPSGLAVLPDGRILIADTHNERIRAIALNGTISTFAGTGIRGFSGDNGAATAAQLALPRGLAAMPDSSVLLADSENHRIRSISATGVITTLTGTGVQGTSADATLAANAVLDTPHAVAATTYGAPAFTDRLVRAILSQSLYNAASETPRATTLTLAATSNLATITAQGSAGTPQGSVTLLDASTTIATAHLSNSSATIPLALSAGQHTLTANYSGDGFNPASSTTTTLNTSPQASTTTLTQPTASYAGLPLTLSATVTPTVATGTVTFTEASTTLSIAHITNGTATGVYLAPASGQHVITATYSGDATYAPSTSATVTASVAPMPDFTLTVQGSPSQTANNGATLQYTLALTASPAPFTGAISLSASGLPTSTTITFAPPQVVPGTGTVTTVMSIPTDKLLASGTKLSPLLLALTIPLLSWRIFRRKRKPLALLILLAATGCGTRIAPNSTAATTTRSYIVTITGTSTNLAGALVTHTAQVNLLVQ